MKGMSMVRMMLIVAAAVIWIAAGAPVADAQSFATVRPGGRGGSWEFYLPLNYTESAIMSGQGGSSVDINADWGLGLGFGYNLTDRFHVSGLWNWTSRSYDATVVGPLGNVQRYSNWLDTSSLSLNGTFYILDGNITPFVTGGFGFTHMDTSVPSGPASGSCWWDPWWGYVCNSYTPTKTEDDVTYNAGVGMRFDVDRRFALQAGYYKTYIDFSNATTTPEFTLWRLDFLFRMR